MDKIEIYYEIVSNFRFVFMQVSIAYCYYYLARQFMRRVAKVWLVGFVYFAVMAFLYYFPIYISSNFFVYACGAGGGFAVMCLLERKNLKQKVFLAVTFFALRQLSLELDICISMAAYKASNYVLEGNHSWRAWFIAYAAVTMIDIILCFGFIFSSVYIIQKVYVYKREDMTGRELLIMTISSLTGILGHQIIEWVARLYEEDTGKITYDIYPYSSLSIVYNIISFGSILVIIVLFQDIKRRQEEEKQNAMLLGQVEDMKNHIGEVERVYRDMRGLRHDLGNHVMILESLYRRNEHEEAQKYVTQLKEQLKEVSLEIKSGNPVTDVILTGKQKEAEDRGIHFLCDFHYPDKTGINAFDVSIVLNNALANAIEAAAGCDGPYVQVSSYRKKNVYMIQVKNSVSGMRNIDEESGLPVTTRERNQGHGLGLVNIRRTAQKYYGDIDIEQDGKEFVLSVMLMIWTLK